MKSARQELKQAGNADSEVASDVPTSATPPGRFVPPQPEELAEQFPHLEIIELLGQGGMGAVYKARQKQLDRLVALKILPPEVEQQTAFAERFTREARSLARLNHPYIVTVFDFGHTAEGLYFFVMEFVEGTDLRHVIQNAKLSSKEALAIIPKICEALQFAHDEGIVHRDIKPENILLDKKGRIKIADFGLAKLVDSPATVYTLTQAGQRMGTPHYMAPEQIEHPDQVDHRADIFSLGVVFYEMLTNELPLGRFSPPSQKVQVDVRLDDVVLRTLEKEPARRYQHASQVGVDVETICSDKHAKTWFSPSQKVSDDVKTIQNRVWLPAVGLLIVGVLHCLGVVGVLLSAFVPGDKGLLLGIFMAAHALIIILGAWNLMHLKSYRWAVAGSIFGIFTPYFPLGQIAGIWALMLLRKKEVKAAFGQEEIEVVIPPRIREFTVSTVKDVRMVYGRGKVEVQKIIRETRPDSQASQEKQESQKSNDAGPPKSLGMGIASFVLGLVSIFVLSLSTSSPGKFVGFPLIFIAGVLGVTAIKNIKNYRKHPVETGFAVAGIIFALISVITLLVN